LSTLRVILSTGELAERKQTYFVPHDMGSPAEDPFVLSNIYNYQQTNRWKDLPSKFVLQVYRDYEATSDEAFLRGKINFPLDGCFLFSAPCRLLCAGRFARNFGTNNESALQFRTGADKKHCASIA
jgi:hypothetical protein